MTPDPLDRDALVRLARAALARLDFEGAIEALFKVEHDPETRILLARAYRNTARVQQARKLLEPLTHHPDAATELGILELAMGKPDRAHALFTKALEHTDFEWHAEAIHGLAYIAEGRTRGADRSEVYALLKRGLERHPDHHVLLQTLGITHLNDGHIEEALEIFAKVIAIRADAPWAGTRFEVEAHGNFACALVAADRIDEALAAVERTMEVCPRWFRQGMAMAMESDPDLAAIHDHPKFIASMLYRRGGTYEERIAQAEAMIAAQNEEPPALPDLDALETEARSKVGSRVEEACRTIHELVSAREEIWEDHGWCEERIRTHAEAVIERLLRDVTWLRDAALADPSSACIDLTALMLVSYDAKLSALGRPLALELLQRWLPTDPVAVTELLDALTWERWEEEGMRAMLPECAPALVAAARSDAPTFVRTSALQALAAQGSAEHAPQIADLVDDDEIAAVVVRTVHALDPAPLDPEPLLHRASTRVAVAEIYAEQLYDPCFQELSVVLDELQDHRRNSLLRALMRVGDVRLVPAVLEQCTREFETYPCMAWLRTQPLTDAQLNALMAKRFEAKRAAYWLADVARAQGRFVTISDIACLPPLDEAPDEGTASLVGYANVRDRLDWIRGHVAQADRSTLRGIVIALSRIGEASDCELLERLGARVEWLRTPTALARMLLGEDLSLAESVLPRDPFAVWALERLVDRHGPAPELLAAVDRAQERGLHNEDLAEFRRVIERLRKARPTGAC